jgi:hypothetical protein
MADNLNIDKSIIHAAGIAADREKRYRECWVTLGSNPRIGRQGGSFRFKAGKAFQS